MHPPKYLVKIPSAGHLVFSDICLIGRSKGGVIGIVKAIHLPIPAELLKLGSDGCTGDHPRVEIAFPAIDQLSVGFFRWALHIDPEPVGPRHRRGRRPRRQRDRRAPGLTLCPVSRRPV